MDTFITTKCGGFIGNINPSPEEEEIEPMLPTGFTKSSEKADEQEEEIKPMLPTSTKTKER